MYTVNDNDKQTILTYSDAFSDRDKPCLRKEIENLNMHKTISIICELIRVRDSKFDQECFWGTIEIPLEASLKNEFCNLNIQSLEELRNNDIMEKDKHIISLQMLLILLKKVIAYGDYDTLKNNKYKIESEDYRKIVELQLLVAEEVSEKHNINIDKEHFIYSTYHLNCNRNILNEFQRMYYLMELLNKKTANCASQKSEYKDYYNDFSLRYGITPIEYISSLFCEFDSYVPDTKFLPCNKLSYTSNWRNVQTMDGELCNKEKIEKALDLLKAEPEKLKQWALETEGEEWDFTLFYRFPYISVGDSDIISISNVTLNNAIFEKLYWLIRDCYPQEQANSMAYFGRIFEQYVKDITKASCEQNQLYTYIDEFIFYSKNTEKKSSDAYIRKDNNLLIIEAKARFILADCMAKNEKVEENKEKLFINPILQADKCLSGIIETDMERFKKIKEAFIISVSLDNINAVPNYYNQIHEKIEQEKKCNLTKYYFNFNIEEYEMLLSIMEHGGDMFGVLKKYFCEEKLSTFIGYVMDDVDYAKMAKPTAFMQKNYDEVIERINGFLGITT